MLTTSKPTTTTEPPTDDTGTIEAAPAEATHPAEPVSGGRPRRYVGRHRASRHRV